MKNITLKELIESLKDGVKNHDSFYFGAYSVQKECGTLGCLLGEMPVLDKRWFIEQGNIFFASDEGKSYSGELAALNYFSEIDIAFEALHLFYPHNQFYLKIPSIDLDMDSSLEDVLENMKLFLDFKFTKNGKIRKLYKDTIKERKH